MKCVLTSVLLLIVLPAVALAQKSSVKISEIDRLNTNTDVQQFLTLRVDSLWKYVSPFEDNKAHTEKFVKAGFLKMDIDSNGLTDLLVYGQDCCIVLDIGNGQYDLFGSCTAPYNMNITSYEQFVDILVVENTPLFVVKKIIWQDGSMTYAPKNDTIIFKFRGFMEYNSKPSQLKIEEISFKSDGGFIGTRFDIKIDASRWVTYEVDGYEGHRIFAGEVDSLSFYNLTQTINYLKFTPPDDPNTSRHIRDGPDYLIEVKFSNGQIKKMTYYLESNLCRKIMNLEQKLPELR